MVISVHKMSARKIWWNRTKC